VRIQELKAFFAFFFCQRQQRKNAGAGGSILFIKMEVINNVGAF
jgi:hypothetical protein